MSGIYHQKSSPDYAPITVERMLPRIVHHALVLRGQFFRLARRGEEFYMEQVVAKFAMDVTLDIVLGLPFGTHGADSSIPSSVRTLAESSHARTPIVNPAKELRDWWETKRSRARACERIGTMLRSRHRAVKEEIGLPPSKVARCALDRVILQRIEAVHCADDELDDAFVDLSVAE
jgi:hypothetical protein